MLELGILSRLDLRSVWPHEAKNFTPWLAKNLAYLGEVLGMDLELTSLEAGVGGFSLDLLATDLNSGSTVVIENQFASTDHDHFGKVLTYAAGFDARSMIWIAETIREEHQQALEWLNRRTDERTLFFGIELEVLQIDESRPAIRLKPVVMPNEWQKVQRSQASTLTPRAEAYREFFQALIDRLREEHHFTNAKVGQPQNWYSFASGYSGVTYGSNFAQGNQVRTELYIDFGDGAENLALFDWLEENRDQIENELSAQLSWERLEERRACRIALYRPGSIEEDEEALAEISDWAVKQLLNFRKVFGPRLSKYLRS